MACSEKWCVAKNRKQNYRLKQNKTKFFYIRVKNVHLQNLTVKTIYVLISHNVTNLTSKRGF